MNNAKHYLSGDGPLSVVQLISNTEGCPNEN
jgi:hypothetical protein